MFSFIFLFYAAAQCLTEETENGLFEASHAPDGCAEGQGLSPIPKHIFAWTFVRSGTRSSAKATAPDTRGAAIEVPLFTTYSFLLLPGAQEMRRFPGATRSGLQTQSRVGPHPEIPLLGSSRSPAPTVITFLLLPGAVILPGAGPRFPAAVTTVIPSSQARSTACTSRSSTDFSCSVVPTEIFKMRILSLIRSLHTQSIAARISCFLPFPLRSRIFATNKSAFRCRTPVLPAGCSSASAEDSADMRPMPIIIVRRLPPVHQIPERRNPVIKINMRKNPCIQHRHGNSLSCQNFLLVHRKAPAYSYFMVCKKAALCKKQPFSYQLF